MTDRYVPTPAPSPAWTELLLALAGGLLLGLPVLLLNGFPLTFDDTPGYFEPAFNLWRAAAEPAWIKPPEPGTGAVFSGNAFFLRPFPYAVFLLPFTADWTVWLVPLAQGAIAAYAVRRALGAAGLMLGPPAFLGLMLGLALLTSLPVHAGMIMPDLFTAPLILLAYAVAVGWRARPWLWRLFDIAVLAALTTVHLSHVAILGGLAVLLLGWSLLRRDGAVRPGGVPLGLGAPVMMAAGLLMAANLVLAGKAVLSPSSPVFLLARLVGDGPARSYLAEACPERGYLLCSRLDTLDRSAPGYVTSDYFLWHREGARHVFGDDPRFVAEASQIVRETVASRPLEVAGHMAANAARQLVRAGLDVTLTDPVKPWTRQFFSRFGERVYAAFLDSRQMAQAFPRATLTLVHSVVVLAALAVLLWAVLLHGRRMGWRAGGLLAVLTLGLLLNAATTGGLSAVHDRYQNRVIWLVPLAAVAALLAVRRPASSIQQTILATRANPIKANPIKG